MFFRHSKLFNWQFCNCRNFKEILQTLLYKYIKNTSKYTLLLERSVEFRIETISNLSTLPKILKFALYHDMEMNVKIFSPFNIATSIIVSAYNYIIM